MPKTRRLSKITPKFGSTLTSILHQQYPPQSNGRNEVIAGNHKSQPITHPPTNASSHRDKQRTSLDAHVPRTVPEAPSNAFAGQEPLVEDFQTRYITHSPITRSKEHDFSTFSSGQPASDREMPSSPTTSEDELASANGHNDGARVELPAHARYDFTAAIREVIPRSRSPSRASQRSPAGTTQKAHAQRPVAVRQPSGGRTRESGSLTSEVTMGYGYEPGERSSADSVLSQDTTATSLHTLPPLQTKGPDNSEVQHLDPVIEDDPRSYDLLAPPQDVRDVGMYALERRAEQLFSAQHLHIIFGDPKLLLKFTGYLNSHRPSSIPVLIYYLDALKAIRAINYANAIAEALEPLPGYRFTSQVANLTRNAMLEEKAQQAFEVLVRDDLPAYTAHTWIQTVSLSIQRRITGTLAPHLREASEGLAEVFCLTDPSRQDNPIVFASEEFARTTQYGMSYTIGRNCRFLQGPRTNPNSVRRLAEACAAGKELTEVFVNYRRDGSPFMNLLMIAPLMDSRGSIRYYIGAQVDVSGLIKECSGLDGLARLAEKERDAEAAEDDDINSKKDEFQDLSEMFNGAELETVRKYGGRMHKDYVQDTSTLR